MTENPLLQSPGEAIRAARTARSYSLEELSARTKIPPPVLDALERDEYHKVSGPLYIKSFLRTCAGELGLDPDGLLDLYARFSGETRGPAGEPVWEQAEVEITRVGLPWARMVIIAAVTAAVLTAGVLALRGCGGGEPSPPGATTPGAEVQKAVPADTAASRVPAGEAADEPAEAAATGGGDVGRTATPPARDEAPPVAAAATRPAPAARDRSGDLPAAVPADSLLAFEGGRRWRVVMRILVDAPVAVEVGRDNVPGYSRAVWPAAGAEAPRLPAEGIRAGQAYAVREGLAVYWGAADHFRLRMADYGGAEVTLNGVPWDVSALHPGDEAVLDLFGAEARGGR